MRTLVLSATRVPVDEIPVEDAIVKIVTGKAYAVENHPDRVFRSMKLTVPAPLVIGIIEFVDLPRHYYGPASLTANNRTLFLRDGYTCAYCGRHHHDLDQGEHLSRDHVLPVSRGGPDDWENCVTACITCNREKGDLTPGEAGLPVPGPLEAPKRSELFRLRHERRRARFEQEVGELAVA